MPTQEVPIVKKRRPETSYGGQALVFIRDVIDVDGPVFPSVLAFIDRYQDRLVPVPQVGQVVLHDNKPHGNIGLYVGAGMALFMRNSGNPTLMRFDRPYGQQDSYRGAMWWPGSEPLS